MWNQCWVFPGPPNRLELLHQLLRRVSLSFSSLQVHGDDTVEMLPKSRRALTIQEIAALARSSLHGECNRSGIGGEARQPFYSATVFFCCRDFPGSQGPCDQAHGDGSGQGGPSDRVERLV